MTTTPPTEPQTAAAATVAAGWFPDPAGHPLLRYWDGQRWTEQYAQAGPSPYQQGLPGQRSSVLAGLGLLMAILMPIIGFLLGLVLLARRQDRDGLVVVMISIAVLILWFALIVTGA